ncbi:MAG TPA: outer membrane beta-barrel protein [Saprospiraceae bacterium]|nr:outer membrane beta-barrel protein [Saprospiraceae bacterium]HPI05302.1 outer membrane beta-barrel protein [Saprospiraceae bacterium]
MLQRFFATGIALSCLFVAQAQQSATPVDTTIAAPAAPAPSPFTFSGGADAYFRYNLGDEAANNFTSFTNSQNSFELGMVTVKGEHTKGKVGMVADIGFGQRAEDFSYNDANTRFIIKQLYLSYTIKDKVKLTAGSWATHVGYELVDAFGNRNYSMSYMFSYGPFFHTGLKAETSFGKSGFMLGVANPTDLKSANFSNKYIIGQYSVASKNDKIKAYLNFQAGKPDDVTKVSQIDLVATGAVTDKFSIGLNGTLAGVKSKPTTDGDYGDASTWYGAAVYLNLDPTSWLGLTLRSEYFNDDDQLLVFSGAAAGGNILATTLSANFKVEGLTLIPEIRFEKASEDVFLSSSGAATSTSTTLLVAAVYKF